MIPNLAELVREAFLSLCCYGDRGRARGGEKLGEAKRN